MILVSVEYNELREQTNCQICFVTQREIWMVVTRLNDVELMGESGRARVEISRKYEDKFFGWGLG